MKQHRLLRSRWPTPALAAKKTPYRQIDYQVDNNKAEEHCIVRGTHEKSQINNIAHEPKSV